MCFVCVILCGVCVLGGVLKVRVRAEVACVGVLWVCAITCHVSLHVYGCSDKHRKERLTDTRTSTHNPYWKQTRNELTTQTVNQILTTTTHSRSQTVTTNAQRHVYVKKHQKLATFLEPTKR